MKDNLLRRATSRNGRRNGIDAPVKSATPFHFVKIERGKIEEWKRTKKINLSQSTQRSQWTIWDLRDKYGGRIGIDAPV